MGKKEKQPSAPRAPTAPREVVAPKACAASSITGMPRSAARSKSARSAGRPNRWTGRMARVLSVMAARTALGSRLYVSGSMSAKTGVAPTRRIAPAVAKKDSGVVMTSSPAPSSSAMSETSSASEPDDTPIACSTPSARAASASSFATSSPRMKDALASTRSNAVRSLGAKNAVSALRSWSTTVGMGSGLGSAGATGRQDSSSIT
ncbi:MAG: hypothetical protein IPM79_23870 [Polyangiaceae bacterium]|nr:hypothetical protein [Polyangiaceae bacterium]